MTRTVKELREELAKFRDDAVCYAYEGEVTGIVISPPGSWGGPGVIYCGESADVEPPTENHPSVTSREVLVRASDYDALAVENAALKDECAALVNGDEYQAMQRTLGEVNARLAEALERAAAAESKEVCTVAHSDEVMEFCPYCKIERLTARLAEAMEGTERLRGLLSRLLGTRNAECRALARLEVAQNNYLDHRQELADYESASLAASACEAEARVAIDAAIAAEQQGAGNE